MGNVVKVVAEGGGIEPLTLLRCHPGIRSRLPDHSSGTFRVSWRKVLESNQARPYLGAHGLASHCIATLPTFPRQDDEDDRDRLLAKLRVNMGED